MSTSSRAAVGAWTCTYKVCMPSGAATLARNDAAGNWSRLATAEPTRRPPLSRSGSRNTSTRSAPGARTWTTKLRPTVSPACGAWISARIRGTTVGTAGTTTGTTTGGAGTEPRLGTTTCTLLSHVPRSGVCAARVSVVAPKGTLLSGMVIANPAVLQSG